MKILLVEDHPGLAKISCDLLRERYCHEVEHAATGARAFAAAMKNPPDLILLDLSLPDMHGYRLAEKLRAQPSLDRTLIVALTGHGITGTPALSKAAGIDAHYRKPMDFSELTKLREDTSRTAAARGGERGPLPFPR
jgi:CheY-like chemotaxis protein